MRELQRICLKLYAPEPAGVSDALFVPIFHEWIRERVPGFVFVDVADYAHVPEGPGVVLVCHELSFAIDRSAGRFGLFAQRRRPAPGTPTGAIAEIWRCARQIAARLERDRRLAGKLAFDPYHLRVEANDRLRAPNTEESFAALEPLVRAAAGELHPGAEIIIHRVRNDPRDRLAADVHISSGKEPSHWPRLF